MFPAGEKGTTIVTVPPGDSADLPHATCIMQSASAAMASRTLNIARSSVSALQTDSWLASGRKLT
jgi:hypothetical protein